MHIFYYLCQYLITNFNNIIYKDKYNTPNAESLATDAFGAHEKMVLNLFKPIKVYVLLFYNILYA